MQDIGIIGFGRFGKLLADILSKDFRVHVFDSNPFLAKESLKINIKIDHLETVLECKTIFYCVPISSLKDVISEHLIFFRKASENKTIIDVLSVKTYPKKLFAKLLPQDYEILLTHPMFGPDSVKAKGLAGQPIVIDNYRTSNETFSFWKGYFLAKELKVIEMTSEEHDQLAARSQGITHIVGRILDEFKFDPTAIDTLGTKKLYEIKEQTCNDTWQLFSDLQNYNPFTDQMRNDLSQAFDRVIKKIKKAESE